MPAMFSMSKGTWKIARSLGHVLGVIGFVLFMGSICGGAWRMIARAEEPLMTLGSITRDANGRIYCGMFFYQRVQVYEADGTYVGGWFVGAAGGHFSLAVSGTGIVQVAIARGDFLEEYTKEGRLLSRRKLDRLEYEEFPCSTKIALPGQPGCFLVPNRSLLFPGVKRRCGPGNETWVVRNSPWLWPLSAPFPAFGYLLIGIGLVYLSGVKLSR